MVNEKNLVPQNKRTKEEQREIARKGGKASGAKRRELKTAREFAIAALNAVTKTKEGKEIVVKDAAIQKQLQRALVDADLKAFEFLLGLAGELPSQKIELTGKDGKDIIQKDLSRDEARELVKEMGKEFGWDSASK